VLEAILMAGPKRRSRRWQRPGRLCWLAIALIIGGSPLAYGQQQISPLSLYAPPNPYGDPTAAPPGQSALQQSVVLRNRPDYDPLGIHAGGFLIYPKLEIGERYDDNIRATQHNRLDDFATTIAPSVAVESTWSRHALGLQAFGVFEEFADHSSENTSEYGVNLTGRLDMTEQDFLSGFTSYSHQVQPRDEPDDTGQRKPSAFDHYIAQSTYAHRFSRVEVSLNSRLDRLDYTTSFDNDRDRTDLTIGPRVSYLLSPSFIPFVQVGYLNENFDAPLDRSGVDRDSQSYNGSAGFTFDIDTILSGQITVGETHTNFDDPSFKDATFFGFDGVLTWNVTTLTTITGEISRREVVTTQAGSSSRIATQGSISVDHQLLHNVLIGGSLMYRNDNYQTSSRNDNTFDATIGVSYLLNRNAAISLSYAHEMRDSNFTDAGFDDNTVRLGLDLHM